MSDGAKQIRELPPIRAIRDLIKNPPKKRDEVIKGILRTSSKMAIAGASKARKTWQLISLAICAATGHVWLDRFEIVKTKVIYINLELHEDTFWDRLSVICDAMGISTDSIADVMSSWCLRGFAAGYDDILPAIIDKIRNDGYGLIIFDPTYKILGDLDENRAGDITKLMNALEEVCFKTGAALVMVNHYGRGGWWSRSRNWRQDPRFERVLVGP
jgi:RecA-family ATPase